MKNLVLQSYQDLLAGLPDRVRKESDKAFRLFEADPRYPGLQYKKIGRFSGYDECWSLRIGDGYRAVCQPSSDARRWFWIGPHEAYNRLLGRKNPMGATKSSGIARRGSTVVKFDRTEIRDFKKRWPCSGIPDGPLALTIDGSGDLLSTSPAKAFSAAEPEALAALLATARTAMQGARSNPGNAEDPIAANPAIPRRFAHLSPELAAAKTKAQEKWGLGGFAQEYRPPNQPGPLFATKRTVGYYDDQGRITMMGSSWESFDDAFDKVAPVEPRSDNPSWWTHEGGGCLLQGGGNYPCDDTYRNGTTGEEVTFRTTQEAHFSMPSRARSLAEVARIPGVAKDPKRVTRAEIVADLRDRGYKVDSLGRRRNAVDDEGPEDIADGAACCVSCKAGPAEAPWCANGACDCHANGVPGETCPHGNSWGAGCTDCDEAEGVFAAQRAQNPRGGFYVEVRCETPGCRNSGKAINKITGFKSGADVDAFMEGWSPEDDERDTCKLCGQPGVAEGFGANPGRKSMGPISEEEFEEYGPYLRADGNYFEHEDVVKKPLHNVWTVVEGDDEGLYASPGFHIVNKIGYLLTKKPWKSAARDAIWYTPERSDNPRARFGRTYLEAYRFFKQNAGGVVGESSLGADALARAEMAVQRDIDRGRAEYEWEPDQDPDLSWCQGCESGAHARPEVGGHGLWVCVLKKDRQVVASLGDIDFGAGDNVTPSDPYKRVVEAELAAEAYHGKRLPSRRNPSRRA